tara:strand:- start:109 stop:291 length:183 start_codon:yes stop_codon:yes gene_type:complete
MKLNNEQKKMLIEEFEKLNEPSQEDIFEQIQHWADDTGNEVIIKRLWTDKDFYKLKGESK